MKQIPPPAVVSIEIPFPHWSDLMLKLSALAFAVAVVLPLPAIAYTQNDVAACMPDAMRLCQQAMPNERRVVHCLVRKRRQLKSACAMAVNRGIAAISARRRAVTVQQAIR
jgi:hypothetical protein